MKIALYIAILVALVSAAFLIYEYSYAPETPGDSVACTADAKICPDGSAVGRVGPDCEFAVCPGETE